MSKFEGTIESIVFRNEENGWTVASFHMDRSGSLSAVGVMPFLAAGEHVILNGELTEHREYGEQIKVSSYEVTMPKTRSALEKYLGSGLIKGIGPATAKLIVKKFGSETLDVLESEPERLTEIPGIGPKKAAMIAESFAEQNEMRSTLIFLQGAGLTPTLAMKVYRAYGDQSERVLRGNPYRLADEIDGVGFKTADEIAQSLGFGADNPDRLASGVRYVLTQAASNSGHVFLPRTKLCEYAAQTLGVSIAQAEATISSMRIKDQLIEEAVDDVSAIYLPNMYRMETETADLILKRLNAPQKKQKIQFNVDAGIVHCEQKLGVTLGAAQRKAVIAAVSGDFTIITGGPGTGKTTSINCILELLEERGKIELCAPTGRAAKRMSEATGRDACTIHRLLEYGGEAEGFKRNADNPLTANTVVVDEMSMVDLYLMRALLRAVKPGARLILVGDADQLPSVGAGNVLRDLIDSGAVPVARLDEIFRQAQQSRIVVNAHRINRGQYPLIQNHDTDFFLERKESAADVGASVVALVQYRLPRFLGVDSLHGVQVMAPMKKGALGVYQLNRQLQAALNPSIGNEKTEFQRGDTVFRLGDKVMQVRNDYDIEWTRGVETGTGVFNGDIGYIKKLSRISREMTVEFDDGRCATYDDTMLDELELSYCISVHKSQGSEFDAVVLPLLSGPPLLMTRNLLYTAVTRAKRLVVIVGRETCVRSMIDNNHILRRYTALALRLKMVKKQ